MDRPHWSATESTARQLAIVLTALESNKLTLTNINANDAHLLGTPVQPEPRPLSTDADLRRILINWHCDALQIAADLGAAPLSFATGPRSPSLSSDDANDLLRRHLDHVLHRADALKVPLSIEFEPGHHIDSWASLSPWFAEYDSPLFGANFDIGHAAVANEDVVTTLETALPHCHNLHFEDIRGDIHEHLVPGDGDLDLDGVLKLLERDNYDRGLTIELYNHAERADDVLPRCRNWFEQRRPEWLRESAPL